MRPQRNPAHVDQADALARDDHADDRPVDRAPGELLEAPALPGLPRQPDLGEQLGGFQRRRERPEEELRRGNPALPRRPARDEHAVRSQDRRREVSRGIRDFTANQQFCAQSITKAKSADFRGTGQIIRDDSDGSGTAQRRHQLVLLLPPFPPPEGP